MIRSQGDRVRHHIQRRGRRQPRSRASCGDQIGCTGERHQDSERTIYREVRSDGTEYRSSRYGRTCYCSPTSAQISDCKIASGDGHGRTNTCWVGDAAAWGECYDPRDDCEARRGRVHQVTLKRQGPRLGRVARNLDSERSGYCPATDRVGISVDNVRSRVRQGESSIS